MLAGANQEQAQSGWATNFTLRTLRAQDRSGDTSGLTELREQVSVAKEMGTSAG